MVCSQAGIEGFRAVFREVGIGAGFCDRPEVPRGRQDWNGSRLSKCHSQVIGCIQSMPFLRRPVAVVLRLASKPMQAFAVAQEAASAFCSVRECPNRTSPIPESFARRYEAICDEHVSLRMSASVLLYRGN